MDVLICVDDADDIDSRGTGEIAELMARGLETGGVRTCFGCRSRRWIPAGSRA